MHFILIIFATLASLTSMAQSYRWDVKIAIDTAGQRLYDAEAQKETIQNLAQDNNNPTPALKERQKGKRANNEKRKVTIVGYITSTGQEDDGDYHLVVQALNGTQTLIAEIPDPKTPKLKGFPGYRATYTKARSEVDTKIGAPANNVRALKQKHKVIITGIVFFDKHAHGKGHSDNDVEIHPVLSIKVLD
ncbi:MAG: hypothetical protein JWO32_741 [Bacteroidetes bacterium]|nr:hypothetical protein [Bacteroidota bacterium]